MKKLLEIIDISLTDLSKVLKNVENIPIDSEASNQLHYFLQEIEQIVVNTEEEIRKFKEENNLMENNLNDKKIVEQNANYMITEFKGIPSMYVSEEFVKRHTNKSQGYLKHYIQSDISIKVKGIKYSDFTIDVVFNKDAGYNNMHRVGGHSGDFGFNWPFVKDTKHELGKTYRNQVFNQLKDMINKEFPENKNTMESKMDEKKLREFIRAKILEFITEQKVLAEAEKEGHGKPTSGLKKEKVGTTHTEKTKSKNPPAKKVTDGGPENKTLATAEPTKVESENKEKKEPDNTEFADRGKYVKEGNGYKTECMGVELDVKGSSYADINHLYLLAQMKKALEGRGEFIKKVTVEMGPKEKEEIKESKEVKQLRAKIREIVKEQLKKKKFK